MKRFEELKTVIVEVGDSIGNFFVESYDSIATMISSL